MSLYPNSGHADPIDLKQTLPDLPAGDERGVAPSPSPSPTDRTGGQSNLPSGADPGDSRRPASSNQDDAAGQPELSDAVKALRDAPERQMFDAHKQYSGVFQRGTFQDALAGEDPEVVAAIDREAAGIYSDFRLSNPEAQTVHEAFCTEVTDDLADQWRSDSEAYIKSLGPHGPAKLALAQKLVARDPRVAELLKGPHGDNPRIVQLVIEKAQSEQSAGRLK